MKLRYLHAADLHLDSPLKGLDRYPGAPVDQLRTATRGALERLVSFALERRVDFVLLAGDIYDRDWQDFHTGLYFRAEMIRLARAGIRVFMILGNHDAEGTISRPLPLPDNVTTFSSRAAQTVQLDDLGVAIHGRSFPSRAVTEDLVPEYPPAVAGLVNIGLLHTSLNGREGHDTYAPTTLERLTDKGYDYWALGHVHQREIVSDTPLVVYPGNLQGRHANETGAKGCELVEFDGTAIHHEPIALDVARWHRINIDVTGLEHPDALQHRASACIGEFAESGDIDLLALRVTLTGVSSLIETEARFPGALDAVVRQSAQDITGTDVWVERVKLDLRAPKSPRDAANRSDAVAELMRLADELAASPDALLSFVQTELGDLLKLLPPELELDASTVSDDAEAARALLSAACATALAHLESGVPD
ncbi:MAG: DNA repair exonuclease [Pseudomonadota bacterium]